MSKSKRQQTVTYEVGDRVVITWEGMKHRGTIIKVYPGKKWDTVTIEIDKDVIMTVGAEDVVSHVR